VTARALLDMPDSRITCDDSGEVSMAYARRKSASWIKCCQDCPQRVGTTMAVSTRTIRCASSPKHPGGSLVWYSKSHVEPHSANESVSHTQPT
jgi:phage FluMu gp28-like protein